ncbi:three-Cys-motif partner protein TcmP [Marinobacter sp. R17]|uniref:three-Cys-motif partner protein TcmP n=1 Tax=Marinobacter sp. R17 TaxID=2484250 RepID=UPI000F4B055C|nr:three-Cys-motif partner protein TcmP [Marinobacter sp. R17]ROT94365.1 three-Cys-motif partner protein TcmP [Marinobacter sp. R17]
MAKRQETLWELNEHSLGKHLVLKSYINAWFPILSKYNGRLLFIDGFAGPGEYNNGYIGSPLIALDAALNHQHQAVREQEIVFFFIENDKKRLDHLKSLIEERYPNLPSNFKVHFSESKFDAAMTHLLDYIEEQNKKLAPCFAMIDPFGVSDTPMSIVHRILKNPKAEVYVSVMYEYINRFLGSPEFEPHLNELFGGNEWVQAKAIEDKHEKKEFLYQVYKSKLKESRATNAIHFELFKGNRHVYSIFFATQSWMGTDKMKSAIWNIAPGGDFVFRGMANNELDLASPDYGPLIDAIVEQFSGRWVTPRRIAEFVGSDRTDYHSSQFKKNALKVLEKDERLTIHPEDAHKRKKRFTYRDDIRLMIDAEPRD